MHTPQSDFPPLLMDVRFVLVVYCKFIAAIVLMKTHQLMKATRALCLDSQFPCNTLAMNSVISNIYE